MNPYLLFYLLGIPCGAFWCALIAWPFVRRRFDTALAQGADEERERWETALSGYTEEVRRMRSLPIELVGGPWDGKQLSVPAPVTRVVLQSEEQMETYIFHPDAQHPDRKIRVFRHIPL